MKIKVETKKCKVIFLVTLFLVCCLPDVAFVVSMHTNQNLEARTFFQVYNTLLGPQQNPVPLATSSPTGLSPTQIRKAYNLPSRGGNGTIAIIDAYDSPTVQSDFVAFSNQYGLPTGNFEKHKMVPSIAVDGNWGLEISLDVQWAHAVAPNATILLVEAQSNLLSNLLAAVNYATSRPDVVAVSMSWGTQEFLGQNNYDSYFNSSNGIAFFASSGDNGAGVIYPSTSPNVVAVGGTHLSFYSNGTFASETGWSGSGGGVSAYEVEPQYQQSYNVSGANGKRAVPDVSYNADPASGFSVYDTTAYQGQTGWFQLGGTSAGAPQWAAIHSLGLSSTNNNFYKDSKTNQAVFLRDITSGSNGAYFASAGYDLVTGLGSPLTWNYSSGGGLDFSISTRPSELTLRNGTSGTFEIVLDSLNGFSGGVSLSLFSPEGWTASLNSSHPVLAIEGLNSSIISLTVPSTVSSGHYNFTVNASSGSFRHTASFDVYVQTVPSAPLSLTATGNSAIALNWTAPADNGGLAFTNYTIYRGVSAETKTKIATVAADVFYYADLTAVKGQTYRYQVSANNSIGESALSNEANATMQIATLNVTVNTDQPRYVKWSYVHEKVTVNDGLTGVPLQGAMVNVTVTDTHGRIIWTYNGVTDVSGEAQFVYRLFFDAQMGTYVVDVSVSLDGYLTENGQTNFFSLG
jgi:subtilase family serine protease